MSKDIKISELTSFSEQVKSNDGFTAYAVSANYTLTPVDKIKTLYVTTGASAITITTADGITEGRVLEILKYDTGTGAVTFNPYSTETIITPNGSPTTLVISYQGLGIRIKKVSGGWHLLDYLPSAGTIAKKAETSAVGHGTNIDTTAVTLLTYPAAGTIKAGEYEVTCHATFYNGQAQDTGVRYIELSLYKNAGIVKETYCHISNVTGSATEWASGSFEWSGSLLSTDVIYLKAQASTATIVKVSTVNATTAWTVKRLGLVEAL